MSDHGVCITYTNAENCEAFPIHTCSHFLIFISTHIFSEELWDWSSELDLWTDIEQLSYYWENMITLKPLKIHKM